MLATSPAGAACVQTGTTVDCTGSSAPFNAGAQNALTVTVEPGATLTGGNNSTGLDLNANNTVTNNGTIAVGNKSQGIRATNNNMVINNGGITTGNNNSTGIQLRDDNTLINSGPIQTGGNSQGIVARDGNTITNTGAITTGGNGSTGIAIRDNNTLTTSGPIHIGGNSAGISAGDNNVITNTSTIVTGGNGSVGIAIGSSNTVTNTTDGFIMVGNNSAAIAACSCTIDNTITNAGTLVAGNNGAGIAVGDRSTVTNTGAIAVANGGTGIEIGNRNTVANGGLIIAGIQGIGIGSPVAPPDRNIISNTGTIAVGINGFGVLANNRNRIVNDGGIFADMGGTGIQVTDHNRVRNNGTISVADAATGVSAGDNNRIRNNGTISTGIFGTAISLGNDNRLVNNGLIIAGAQGFAIDSCGCTSGNRVTNNGIIDGQVSIRGNNQTFNNNGLLTITDPGTPIGVFAFFHEIGGTFNQSATGTLELRVTASPDTSDALTAQNLNLSGTLRAAIQPGLYGPSTLQSNVVSSSISSTITTTFSQFVATSPFFTVTPIYDTSDPTAYTSLSLLLGRIPFGAVAGLTSNEKAVGNGLEAGYSTSLTGNAATFYSTLLASPTVSVLDAISGEGIAGAQHAAFFAGTLFGNALNSQTSQFVQNSFAGSQGGGGAGFGEALNYAQPKQPKTSNNPLADFAGDAQAARRWQPWVSLAGGTRSISGDAVIGSADVSQRSAAIAMGLGYAPSPDLMVGAAVGGSESSFSVPDRATSGDLDGGHVGVYGAARFQSYYVSGTVNYGRFDNSTTRTIVGLGPTEIAKGSFASDLLAARIEAGRRFDFWRIGVTPFAAVEAAQLWERGFAETSATTTGAPGILGLAFAPVSVASLPSFLGATIDSRIAFGNGQVLTPFVKASWMHEFSRDRTVAGSFITIPTASFTVFGPSAASDAARVEAGARLAVSPTAALFLSFNGEFSGVSASYVGNGGFRMVW